MNENYWQVKSMVKPSIFLITALNFKEMSCGTLWIQYGTTDIARMKDPNVIYYAYFSPLCSKNIISGSCQYTQNRGRQVQNVTPTHCSGQRMLFHYFWHRTLTFTPDRRTKFVFFFICSNVLRQEKRFLWRVMYVYMGFTNPFLLHVTTTLSEVQSRLSNVRREIISRPKFCNCYTTAQQLGGEVFNNYDYL